MPDFMMKAIEKEAGFLLHPKGRTVFMILLALLMFGEDTLGIVLAVILILLGIINGIVLYMYEEEYVSSYAQYDDSYASSSRDGKFSAPRLEEEGRLAGSSSDGYRRPIDPPTPAVDVDDSDSELGEEI
mgnify:FL=1